MHRKCNNVFLSEERKMRKDKLKRTRLEYIILINTYKHIVKCLECDYSCFGLVI
jgi:hypothetical protein